MKEYHIKSFDLQNLNSSKLFEGILNFKQVDMSHADPKITTLLNISDNFEKRCFNGFLVRDDYECSWQMDII